MADDTRVSDPTMASGGLCAPHVKMYEFFKPRVIPDTPEGLLDLWREDLKQMEVDPAAGYPGERPPRWRPFLRRAYSEALADHRVMDRRISDLSAAIRELEFCLRGGGSTASISFLLPEITAPRGPIRFFSYGAEAG